ncbi:hypothetical protein AB0F11_13045 [Streptomyces sp. NPDC032472]|uniref:hypothetical protein n=1 Tax=Streptomyces sp. NPDC032472 TaxID=3155018 RepID=UPI0033C46AAD
MADRGADHFGFCDGPVLQQRFGLQTGDIPADRAVAVTRACVTAFFDEHPRGVPQPLLAGPSPAQPEVRLHSP